LKRLFDRITFKKENSNMKEKKNRLSKLSIVAFVIVSFCVVSVSTQSGQAHTLAASGSTSFIGVMWNYFFPSSSSVISRTSTEADDNKLGEETPTPDFPTPTPCPPALPGMEECLQV
jgi:hypothetical protein